MKILDKMNHSKRNYNIDVTKSGEKSPNDLGMATLNQVSLYHQLWINQVISILQKPIQILDQRILDV